MKPIEFLGANIENVLSVPPLSSWKFRRSIQRGLPHTELYFVSQKHGLEMVCDDDGRVRAVFLRAGDAAQMFELSFEATRADVRKKFGKPTKSDFARRHKHLGFIGAWDRFDFPKFALHIQYRPRVLGIEMVTLMRRDVAP